MNDNPYESPSATPDSTNKSFLGKWIPHVLLWLSGLVLALFCGGPMGLILIAAGTAREAERNKERVAVRPCPKCERELAVTSPICPRCGHRFDCEEAR